MPTKVEYTDEFATWFESLDGDAQDCIDIAAAVLKELGVRMRFPRSSKINGARHGGMRELRGKSRGRRLRVLYAFDPQRVAVLLVGGDKTAEGNRWYKTAVPLADRLFERHLEQLNAEELSSSQT